MSGEEWSAPAAATQPDVGDLLRSGSAFTLAAVGAALIAAVSLPDAPPGAGMVVVGLAVGAAVWLAGPRALPWDATLPAAFGVLLLATAMLRAAEWLVAVNLFAASGLATVAVTRASTWAELALAPLRVAGAALVAPRVLREQARTRRRRLAGVEVAPLVRAVATAAALLVVFGTLFASADRAFAHLASQVLWPDWDVGLLPARVFVFGFVLAATVVFALAHRGVRLEHSPWADRRQAPRRRSLVEWVIPLALLDLLFLAFVLVQLAVLFGGSRHVLATAGLTYAEYAIQGFHQLLAVAGLTLAVVAWAVRSARRESARDDALLRGLLGVLCALTLVVLVSAFRRLALYEEMFGFSRDRLIPHALVVWTGGLLLLVMAAGTIRRASWLPRAVVAFTAASLLAFTALDPDGFVAARNVERFEATGKIDLDYLGTLSADAVPAAARLPARERCIVLSAIAEGLPAAESWASFNVGRTRARGVLESHRCPR